MKTEDLINEILQEIKELRKEQEATNAILKEQQSFWSKVVNDEFLKEFVENNESLKKLG